MRKRRIGNIDVSEIGMGCMGFSHGYGRIPDREYSIEAIRKAADYGCTFFDTAEVYGMQTQYPGHNEEMLGEAVEGFRERIVLATKIHPMAESLTASGDLYSIFKNHLAASLKRLRTDYVDLYYLHRMEDGISAEEVAHVMGRLIGDGLIRAWGLSQVNVDTLSAAHGVTPVSAVQNLYNILERDCEKDIFPYCIENSIVVVPFSPIASGLLSGKITVNTEFEKVDDVRNWVPQLSKENIAGNQPIVEALSSFAERKNATPAQISLAWMLHKYPNVVPIPGSKNQERILENLGASEVELTDAEFAELESALDGLTVYGHRGHVESVKDSIRNNTKNNR